MSKILPATSDASGVVTAESTTVSSATMLSEGNQASTGLLIMQDTLSWYMTSSATDIKTTIEKLVTVIEKTADSVTQIATTLTSIGAGMTGPTTAPPGTLATDVVALNLKVTELNAVKYDLNALKDALK